MAKFPLQIEKKSYYDSYCPNTLKTYPREIKLFEFSQDANRKELKIRKSDITLQNFCCNGFSARLCCNGFVGTALL